VKKKLPIARTPELEVKPVKAASRPEFPTRSELYRKAGVLGGATLLATGLAHAEPNAKPAPAPQKQAIAAQLEEGTINGKPLAKAAPKIKVYREGGGIGPAEDMWQVEDVEAYINWTLAKEGKLALQTKYKLALDGLTLTLDGFDPDRNIGYTYVDPHDPDRMQYTAGVRQKLDDWMKAQKVAILFIEVRRYPDAATLKGKVIKFIHAVRQTPPNPGRIK
jgi:hypothetical protein